MPRNVAVSALFLLGGVISGCGGGGNNIGGSPAVSVSISTPSAYVPTTQSRVFTASVKNDASAKGVTWGLSGNGCSGSSCGVLSAATPTAVTYTAPGTAPVPATVVLTATSVADTSKRAATNLTVFVSTIALGIVPANPSVNTHATVQLTATVLNDPVDAGVTWRMTETTNYCSIFPCGKLSPTSTGNRVPTSYTAPSLIVLPGPNITITATSVTDPTVAASVSMQITCATQSDCIP